MSKAFVKDDHDNSDDLEYSAEPLLISLGEAKNYMTRAGFEELKNEFARLSAAKRSRDEDRRLRLVQKLIEAAEVVDAEPGSRDRAVFGSNVTVVDGSDHESTYRIVGVSESDPKNHKISWLSPVAKALLGVRVGDTATIKTPRGTEDVTIAAVEIPSDRAPNGGTFF